MVLFVGVFAQAAPPTPDLAPLAYWGVAGTLLTALLSLLTWLLMQERREHRALQQKVLDEFLPAILTATAQQRQTTEELQRVAARPNVDPTLFAEWVRTMSRIQDRLDADDRKRRD